LRVLIATDHFAAPAVIPRLEQAYRETVAAAQAAD
jgi:hypothetical protein